MANGIKLLISAFESSGKSTITSKLDKVLVFNMDHKEYGFKVPHANLKDYQGMDALLNEVTVAHTAYDEATSRHIIPATGAFAKAGSWLSVVNDAIFIEKKSNKLMVHTSGLKYPARTTLEDLPTNVESTEYDLQDHISKLQATKFEATEFEL
jgi:hypothetical protein